MRVLIVSSANSGKISPFVYEQVESIKRLGVEFIYFSVVGKGILGYLKNVKPLRRKIKEYQPDLIHAHYGLSGFLSVLAKGGIPLIVTFHGSDINPLNPFIPNSNKLIAWIVHLLSNRSIFVTDKLASQIAAKKSKSDIIPCHVDLGTFYEISKESARNKLGLQTSKRYVLFSSSFNTPVKNYPLAKQSCLTFDNLELIELKGYSRQQVNLLLNACDLALITSYNEGSCQFLKEALACNRPIVSTKAGDAELVLGHIEGCYLTDFNKEEVVRNISKALDFCHDKGHTSGRNRISELGLDSETISRKVLGVYNKVLNC